MNNYFIGNDNFYFLLSEVTDVPIKKIKDICEVQETKNENILILESLAHIINLQDIEHLFFAVVIYTDEIKIVQLNKFKTLNIKIILKEKKDYIFCNNQIESLGKKLSLSENDEIILSDISEEAVVKLGEIYYFSYDRINKKSFAKINKESFFIRKNLGELETLLPKHLFFRMERSYIINLKQIKLINFKEEFVLLKNDEKIYVNKGKLKILSNKLDKKYNRL
jgi:hypothetical protein